MPKIGLANDVTIEYTREVDDEANYKFTKDLPDLGDFAKEGVLFSLQTRRESERKDDFLYTFQTEDGVKFQLYEDTFSRYIETKTIVKIDT